MPQGIHGLDRFDQVSDDSFDFVLLQGRPSNFASGANDAPWPQQVFEDSSAMTQRELHDLGGMGISVPCVSMVILAMMVSQVL